MELGDLLERGAFGREAGEGEDKAGDLGEFDERDVVAVRLGRVLAVLSGVVGAGAGRFRVFGGGGRGRGASSSWSSAEQRFYKSRVPSPLLTCTQREKA